MADVVVGLDGREVEIEETDAEKEMVDHFRQFLANERLQGRNPCAVAFVSVGAHADRGMVSSVGWSCHGPFENLSTIVLSHASVQLTHATRDDEYIMHAG